MSRPTACLDAAAPYFPGLIYLFGICGWAGSTILISLTSDALSVLTVHLYLSYMVATTVFSQQLSVLASLWRLFRGRQTCSTWLYEQALIVSFLLRQTAERA